MILYHFTALEYLDAIKASGLTRGDIPISRTEGLNGVWLTMDGKSDGHGLTDGGPVDPAAFLSLTGRMPPAGLRYPDKRAVRIEVSILSTDRRLKHWPRWARKRLAPEWYDDLDATGGGKSKTWYVYFGAIPPEQFREVKILRQSGIAA